jgi:hypothetical protein
MPEKNPTRDLVEAYMPDAPEAEKEALVTELRELFDVLYQSFVESERFDGMAGGMVDSDSPVTGDI